MGGPHGAARRGSDVKECPGNIEIYWCRRGESNPRPRDYETLALPLSYAGIRQFFMLRTRRQMCQAFSARGSILHRNITNLRLPEQSAKRSFLFPDLPLDGWVPLA